MTEICLQKIVFPEVEEFKIHNNLFYKSERLVMEDGGVWIPAHSVVDFATYLNGLSYEKWHGYTGAENIMLSLRARGKLRINLVGYSLAPSKAIRKLYHTEQVTLEEVKELKLSFNDITDEFLAFEIEALEDSFIAGGEYTCAYEEADIHEVNLAIATTTFRKEDYIKKNIGILKKDLLESGEDISEHLFINVVDNGRTLAKEEIEAPHIRLFFNDNVGGSGGFSRGMYESIHMEPAITNVLLMDDDVLMMSESIRRTYTLLTVLKPEYQKSFISGTMLELDAMWLMHEDIGLVKGNKDFYHAKPIYDARKLEDVLQSNREFPRHKHQYCGWWYCCIPAETIKEKGFSLPLFIRGDDAEYGLRCNPHIITMSGICVWHMGFGGKFSVHTNYYQEFRNMLIVKDAGGKIPDVDVFGRWKQECLRSALTFDYKGWELLLIAMEDYMKGPGFIEEDHGTEILQRNKQYAETMHPLTDPETPSMYMDMLYEPDIQMSMLKNRKYYKTYNGQKGYPEDKLDPTPAIIRQDWDHKPGRCAFHSKIFVVDPFNRTGCMREMDREKFNVLLKRQEEDVKAYENMHSQLEKDYREAYSYMVSEEFWKKYLKLS